MSQGSVQEASGELLPEGKEEGCLPFGIPGTASVCSSPSRDFTKSVQAHNKRQPPPPSPSQRLSPCLHPPSAERPSLNCFPGRLLRQRPHCRSQAGRPHDLLGCAGC